MDFEILVDDSLFNLNTDASVHLTKNEKVLSIINDFEDNEWRYGHFQNFIWDNIAETSLSKKERDSYIGNPHSTLSLAARSLRLSDKENDISKGSEIAEIVLYAIMKHHFKALPVVPKIFYKQNSQDNAKGADSVHIVIDENKHFTIWFGEAKFYNSIEDTRLNEIITSVKNSLSSDKLKRENSIITNVSDIDFLIDDNTIKEQIKSILSPTTSIDKIKTILHVPILLLHECELTQNQTIMSYEYKKEVIQHHKSRARSYFEKQINSMSTIPFYSDIKFHLILFPVPLKSKIIDKFILNATFYKNN